MNILTIKSIIFFIVSFLNLFIAILIWIKGKDRSSIYLVWATVFSSIYVFSNGIKYLFSSVELVNLFSRMSWSGVMMLPCAVAFVYYFFNKEEEISLKKIKINKIKISLLFLLTLIIFILALYLPIFVSKGWIEESIVEMVRVLGRIYTSLGVVGLLFFIISHYFKSSGLKKIQSKYFILGIAIYSFAIMVGVGLVPLIFGNLTETTVEISALFSFIPVSLVSYAILKHRLFDIRIVLGKIGIYIFSTFSIIIFVLLLEFINKNIFNFSFNIFLLFISIIIFFISFPIYHFFEKLAAKYFYYTIYNLQSTLNSLIGELNSAIELEEVTDLIYRHFLDALKLKKIAVVLKGSESDKGKTKEIKLEKSFNFKEKDIVQLLKNNIFIWEYLRRKGKVLVREEISFSLSKKGEKERKQFIALKQNLNKMGIGLLLPLVIEEKIIGILVLGEKVSEEGFSIQEIDILNFFSGQIALAFNNSLSYEEVRRRKEDLEKFYNITIGRELKMVELKKKIKKLEDLIEKSNISKARE